MKGLATLSTLCVLVVCTALRSSAAQGTLHQAVAAVSAPLGSKGRAGIGGHDRQHSVLIRGKTRDGTRFKQNPKTVKLPFPYYQFGDDKRYGIPYNLKAPSPIPPTPAPQLQQQSPPIGPRASPCEMGFICTSGNFPQNFPSYYEPKPIKDDDDGDGDTYNNKIDKKIHREFGPYAEWTYVMYKNSAGKGIAVDDGYGPPNMIPRSSSYLMMPPPCAPPNPAFPGYPGYQRFDCGQGSYPYNGDTVDGAPYPNFGPH